jgi:hypothetical protein
MAQAAHDAVKVCLDKEGVREMSACLLAAYLEGGSK